MHQRGTICFLNFTPKKAKKISQVNVFPYRASSIALQEVIRPWNESRALPVFTMSLNILQNNLPYLPK